MAVLARHHPNRPDLLAPGRLALKAGALERRIVKAITTDPPLTLAQRARLATILLQSPDGDAA